jgi:hypothetical protein
VRGLKAQAMRLGKSLGSLADRPAGAGCRAGVQCGNGDDFGQAHFPQPDAHTTIQLRAGVAAAGSARPFPPHS